MWLSGIKTNNSSKETYLKEIVKKMGESPEFFNRVAPLYRGMRRSQDVRNYVRNLPEFLDNYNVWSKNNDLRLKREQENRIKTLKANPVVFEKTTRIGNNILKGKDLYYTSNNKTNFEGSVKNWDWSAGKPVVDNKTSTSKTIQVQLNTVPKKSTSVSKKSTLVPILKNWNDEATNNGFKDRSEVETWQGWMNQNYNSGLDIDGKFGNNSKQTFNGMTDELKKAWEQFRANGNNTSIQTDTTPIQVDNTTTLVNRPTGKFLPNLDSTPKYDYNISPERIMGYNRGSLFMSGWDNYLSK